MGVFQVSQSKVKKWRQCRCAYHYRYVERLKKIVKARPLQFGSIVHQMIDADANNECPFELLDEIAADQGKMFAAEREFYGEIVEDIRTIMEGYFDYWEDEPLAFNKIGPRRTEHELEVDLCDGIRLVFVLDGIVRTRNKLRWLLENKTGKSIQSDDDNWRNLQSAVYLRACEMLGIKKLTGVLWNFIKSKPPTKPQILKNGGLSSRKIVTLPSVILKLCEEEELDPNDYEELIDSAKMSMVEYYKRVYTPVQPEVVDQIFADFVTTAQEIADRHGKSSERNIGKHCGWCDYEPICRAELTGGDVDFVKEREYETSEREDREEGEEE